MNPFRQILLLTSIAATAVASAADVAADFSSVNNPNGVWSYGSQTTPGGAFTAFTLHDSGPAYSGLGNQDTMRGWNGASDTGVGISYPLVLKNLSTTPFVVTGNDGANSNVTVPANGLILHASRSAFSTIRFTAATAGVYNVAGSFFREQTSTNVYSQRVRVTIAGFSPLDTELTGNGASAAFSLSGISLLAGGTVDFSVASEGPTSTASDAAFFNGGSMGLNATVNPVPEPSALLAFGLPALALLRRKRS